MTKGYEPYPRRRQKERPSAAAVVLLICIIGAILSVILLISITQEERTAEALPDNAPAPPVEAKIKHDSLAPIYTYDGEIIRTYVFTDPDSGVQYLVTDAGGITPRLGKNEHIIGVTDEAE